MSNFAGAKCAQTEACATDLHFFRKFDSEQLERADELEFDKAAELKQEEEDWAGKASTAASENGQNEPHYHPQGAGASCD